MPYEPDKSFEFDIDDIIDDIEHLKINYLITERQRDVLQESIKNLRDAK